MLDHQAQTAPQQATRVLHCDLCIIGAGLTGLNALFAAKENLPKGARVLLIDRHEGAGGMWNETYDYVRLHQPHPMFTAGNIPWNWNKPRDYLATGKEVRAHLRHCLEVLSRDLDLETLFSTEFETSLDAEGKEGPVVHIRCRSLADERPTYIEARRLINAVGYDIQPTAPLALSSRAIVSTTPEGLSRDIPKDARGTAYIIGGGKTGMDTILELNRTRPNLSLILVSGQGTLFGKRDAFAPKGLRRWWKGGLTLPAFADLSARFDGTNEAHVFDHFAQTYAHGPTRSAGQYFYGLLSEKECREIRYALQDTIPDYLSDIVDTRLGPEIRFRSRGPLPARAGSFVVNCTGHILRNSRPYTPYISNSGTTLTITPRSAVHILSSVAAYFLTHLFLRGALPDARLYAVDLEQLLGRGRQLWQFAGTQASFLNTLTMLRLLPGSVFSKCGLDLDLWFPFHRRLAAFLRVKLREKQLQSHCRASLDRVATRENIRCGPL